MRPPPLVLAFISVLAAWLLLAGAADAARVRLLSATVARVEDGDSLIAFSAERRLRIRLLGIDAPELPHESAPGQPFGPEAAAHLAGMVRGKTVRLETYGRDRYNRLLAVVRVDGESVNVALVRAGLAHVYRGETCRAYCAELESAEREARQARAGLWSQPNPERPSTYKRRFRQRGMLS
jgi:endonuclease YncB( thermonuclease family)